MIIDSHVHIGEQILDNGADLSVNRLVHDMDECHVDKALVMAFPWASNEFLSRAVKAHPKRLIGFARVTNPRTKYQSIVELEKAVKELDLKGLKLHPSCQAFTAADREILPLIRKAVELHVPILIHTYPYGPGYFHYSLPEHIDVLKKTVPKAKIIVGHMGGPRFLDLLTAAYDYAETSVTLPMIADLFGIHFATKFIRRIGVDHVIFGSDWSGTIESMRKHLNLVQKMTLTKKEKEKILGENIRKVLEL